MKCLPWLDPKDREAERDGKPVFLFLSDHTFNEVYKPGYALGSGPRGGGYYSFETKAAFKIIMGNLSPKLTKLQTKALFHIGGNKTRIELKRTRDMYAYAKARLASDGPHCDIDPEIIVKYGGDPKCMPLSIRDISIAGQSGRYVPRRRLYVSDLSSHHCCTY